MIRFPRVDVNDNADVSGADLANETQKANETDLPCRFLNHQHRACEKFRPPRDMISPIMFTKPLGVGRLQNGRNLSPINYKSGGCGGCPLRLAKGVGAHGAKRKNRILGRPDRVRRSGPLCSDKKSYRHSGFGAPGGAEHRLVIADRAPPRPQVGTHRSVM
jgi:hypothetical protein